MEGIAKMDMVGNKETTNEVPESAIEAFEARFPSGVTSAQVVAFFQEQGVRVSEATFRRYVQLGFLPRCRRVGRQGKGRHRGSEGIYPTSAARRLCEVKRLLEQQLTIEEIRGMFRVREDDVQAVRERLATIVEAVEAQLRETPDALLARDLEQLRATIAELEAGLRKVAAGVARGRLAARRAI